MDGRWRNRWLSSVDRLLVNGWMGQRMNDWVDG